MMMNPRRRVIPLLALALFFTISFQGVAQKSKPRERDERREEQEEREEQQKRQKPANQSSPNPAQSGEKQRRVDDPDDEEDMNRELWEFAKNTPYESISLLHQRCAADVQSKANGRSRVAYRLAHYACGHSSRSRPPAL